MNDNRMIPCFMAVLAAMGQIMNNQEVLMDAFKNEHEQHHESFAKIDEAQVNTESVMEKMRDFINALDGVVNDL